MALSKLNHGQIIALSPTKLVSFNEFVEILGLDLDSILVDRIFHNVRDKFPVYIGPGMIEYFGYKGDINQSYRSICRIIKKYLSDTEGVNWWIYNNSKYIMRIS